MYWMSADFREAKLHDSQVYNREFWKKAIKVIDPIQGSGKKEEQWAKVTTSRTRLKYSEVQHFDTK